MLLCYKLESDRCLLSALANKFSMKFSSLTWYPLCGFNLLSTKKEDQSDRKEEKDKRSESERETGNRRRGDTDREVV